MIYVDTLVVDAKSGVSGAGRSPKVNLLYCEANEGISAYGIASHRHTPEIEQELSKLCGHDVVITFTPHLTPMARGILAVSYAKLKSDINEQELVKIYQDFYKDAPFVRIMEDGLPNTKYVAYTNYVDISVKIDRRTKRVIVITALDNLIKGASGQAVQNMNLMFGIDEKKALTNYSFYP
ncbi:MAG: N-acetyl-gamma-glutamyl-phosphate reductase [Alphaproteobacteria bacterium ADurb.Bin438]|nr:MAG: N-acetyl-gamma-glutamyl-phosphate reductase [Alphaproteobacteria bacterium ADurb.Bin438]